MAQTVSVIAAAQLRQQDRRLLGRFMISDAVVKAEVSVEPTLALMTIEVKLHAP